MKIKLIFLILPLMIGNLIFSSNSERCPNDISSRALQYTVSIHNKTFGKDNLIINKFEGKDWATLIKCLGDFIGAGSKNFAKFFKEISTLNDQLVHNLNEAFVIFSSIIKNKSKQAKGFSSLTEITPSSIEFKKINFKELEKIKNNFENIQKGLKQIYSNLRSFKFDITIRSNAKKKKELLRALNDQFIMSAVEKAIRDINNVITLLKKIAYSEAIRV